MTRAILLLVPLFFSPLLSAQDTLAPFTLEDAILNVYPKYYPQRLTGLQWIEGSVQYAYVKDNTLFRNGFGKMADLAICSLDSLNAELPEESRMKRFPSIVWIDANTFRFLQNNKLYVVDLRKFTVDEHVQLHPEAEDVDIEPVELHVAYTLENDVYVAVAGNSGAVRVTNDGGDGIVNGKTVHRSEYGITEGLFWSPSGNKLAFHRMDETMVTPYFLEDISSSPSTFDKIRYPMAGQASHHVTIGVFDVKSNKTIFMQTGEPLDQYLTNIAWSPDEAHIYVTHLDRITENLRLVEYDAKSGRATRTILEEHDDKYLEPEHPAQFLDRSPGQFIWWSDRDGWDHLYLYDLNRGLIRQLTSGNWQVTGVLGTDPKEKFLFVEGTGAIAKEDPRGALQNLIYRVELSTGRTERITAADGTHHAVLSSTGEQLIDIWSSTTVPGRTDLLSSSGTVLRTIVDGGDPMKGSAVGTVELFTIPGENGDRLNARLIKPRGFDASRKYPVLVYLYNGPHVKLVSNSFLGGASHWMLHAAERGYLVFTVDGHGSGDRGRDFEQTIHRRLGSVEMLDQLHGVQHLKTLPYVDSTRLAVHGWSFGGFMTTSLMTKAPSVFAVGVGGGPVMDWKLYEIMYTERYMDTPDENPEGYAQAALPDKCSGLEDPLLLIHGGKDDVVLPAHSYAFLKACVDNGEQVDFFVYPGHGHNVRGKDRLHLMTKVLDQIDSVIKP